MPVLQIKYQLKSKALERLEAKILTATVYARDLSQMA